MTVLKDASSAAVYGSAAANGVIVITTKSGNGKTKVSFRSYYGSQSFNKGLSLLNTSQYGDYLYGLAKGGDQLNNEGKFVHPQYGGPTGASDGPVIPEYILAGSRSGLAAGDPAADPSLYKLDLTTVNGAETYLIVKANKQGTNWIDEIMNTAPIMNNELTVSGGNNGNNYFLSLNQYDQKGIMAFTGYKTYSLRANTNFIVKKNIRIGENLQISTISRKVGLSEGSSEDNNAILMATRMQPIIPVYDIAGNFAGTRGSGLGNAKNPYAALYRNRDDKNARISAVGSLFAEVDLFRYFKFKSNLGINYGTNSSYSFDPVTYENSEGRGGFASFRESQSYGYTVTWFNTLSYSRIFNRVHDVNLLVGTEMVQEKGRSVSAANSNYFLDDRNFWQVGSGLNTTPSGTSSEYAGNKYSPVIAKVGYTYDDKYLLNASFRRDGSSNVFGPNNKYGNFGAVSAGWRISNESFFKNIGWMNDLKLRASYGILGNDKIPGFGFLTSYLYGAVKASYPLDGSNVNFQPGLFTKTIGNPDIKWEQSATTTIGLDATLFDKVDVSVDFYKRKTTNMLFLRQLDPNIYGVVDLQPTNVGDMTNKGIDLSLTYRGSANNFKYNANLSFSLYKNTVGDISDPYLEGNSTRIGAFNRSVTGMPISSFYGYIVDGFFQNEADLAALDQTNKGIGKWKYKDINNDHKITPDDRTFIGNPHPKFAMGSNLNASWKNWDITTFLYWKCGGKIANYMRYFTDFNTLDGNRSERTLYDTWTPTNTNAKLPVLDGTDAISGTLPSSYYIEPGGYLRMKNLSIGYSLPVTILNTIGIDRLRVYVQAQNLFTITKYTGLDPEISIMNNGTQDYKNGFVDSNLGVDRGNYPTPKTILFGLELTF
jgi:TonB-linked SusC/RagA family outer membrane protein